MHRPRAHFLDARGEVGLKSQERIRAPDDAVQPRLIQLQLLQEIRAVRLVELRDLRLDGGAYRHHDGAFGLRQLAHAVEPRVAGESALIDVGHVHDGFVGEQVVVAQERLFVGIQAHRPDGLRRIEVLAHPVQEIARANRLLVGGLGRLHRLLIRPVDAVQVGERKLRIDDLDVARRVDGARDVNDVVVLEAPHHVCDGVDFPDVRQELIAEALALRGARDQSCDIDEFHRRGEDLLGMHDGGKLTESRVRQGHHSDVRIDGAERIVLRGDLRPRQGIEQG